jgi:hypothetical protein
MASLLLTGLGVVSANPASDASARLHPTNNNATDTKTNHFFIFDSLSAICSVSLVPL